MLIHACIGASHVIKFGLWRRSLINRIDKPPAEFNETHATGGVTKSGSDEPFRLRWRKYAKQKMAALTVYRRADQTNCTHRARQTASHLVLSGARRWHSACRSSRRLWRPHKSIVAHRSTCKLRHIQRASQRAHRRWSSTGTRPRDVLYVIANGERAVPRITSCRAHSQTGSRVAEACAGHTHTQGRRCSLRGISNDINYGVTGAAVKPHKTCVGHDDTAHSGDNGPWFITAGRKSDR